jgi:hypothetical protein
MHSLLGRHIALFMDDLFYSAYHGMMKSQD